MDLPTRHFVIFFFFNKEKSLKKAQEEVENEGEEFVIAFGSKFVYDLLCNTWETKVTLYNLHTYYSIIFIKSNQYAPMQSLQGSHQIKSIKFSQGQYYKLQLKFKLGN